MVIVDSRKKSRNIRIRDAYIITFDPFASLDIDSVRFRRLTWRNVFTEGDNLPETRPVLPFGCVLFRVLGAGRRRNIEAFSVVSALER